MAVLVPHVDREQELRTHDAHAQWLMNDVLPEVRRRWPVAPGSVHGNIGVSYGALFSWWLSGLHPDTFGWAVCHAGAFAGPAMRSLLERTLSGELKYPGRYFLDCGTFDEHLPHVQMLHAALENLGI
jgi:enterochelin esterase-like enzyme